MLMADGGQNGLAVLEKNSDDVAVVMSDMRMPQMDGAQFLRHVRERYPHIVRLMLTGNNDQETAKKAVNEGAVFRFLNKPCTRESLTEAIDAALEQFQLQRAEQDVLKRTLGECVTAMSSIMALSEDRNILAQWIASADLAVKTDAQDDWQRELGDPCGGNSQQARLS